MSTAVCNSVREVAVYNVEGTIGQLSSPPWYAAAKLLPFPETKLLPFPGNFLETTVVK